MLGSAFGIIKLLAHHAVARDFVALTVMQGMSYLIPLITIPYILRVVGVAGYGKITFALAFVAYFVILTDYGFSLTATRDIALAAENRIERVRIFSSVITIKVALLLLSFALLLGVMFFVPALRVEKGLFIAAFGIVLGNVLMPVWYFQGVQSMGYVTAIQFLGQCIYLALLFHFVHGPDDYALVVVSQSVGLCFAGILGLAVVRYQFGLAFVFPKTRDIRSHFQGGLDVFWSRVFLNLYTTTNIVILGFLATPVVVGQYAVADKILSVLMVAPNAANQAFFPHLARAFSKRGPSGLREVLVQPAMTMVFFGAASFFLVAFFRNPITEIVTGSPDPKITLLLLILAFGLVFSPLGALYTNALVTIGETRLMRNILLVTGLGSFAFAVPVIVIFGANGLAWLTVLIGWGVVALVRWAFQSGTCKNSTARQSA